MDISTRCDNMQQQVRLLYEIFGFEADEIAPFVGIAPTMVKMMIADGQYIKAPTKFSSFSKNADDARDQLIEVIMRKQMAFAPIYAQTELILLQKVAELASNMDADDPNAARKLDLLAKTTATLNQATVAAILSQVSQNKSNDSGMKIEVINTFSN